MTAHIMVINHSPDILQLYRDLLEDAGYRVSTAIFMARSSVEIGRIQPDLLICDYPARREAEAWQFVQALHSAPATAAVPVLVSTTSVTLKDAHAAWFNAHHMPVVHKPFKVDELLSVIKRLLHAASLPMSPTA